MWSVQKRRQLGECFLNITDQLYGWGVVIFNVRLDNINVNDGPVFASIPVRRPILDRVVSDGDDDISRVQECIRWLIRHLPNAAAETRKLLARDRTRGLKGSDNGNRRSAKQIANGFTELRLAGHEPQQDHRRFR